MTRDAFALPPGGRVHTDVSLVGRGVVGLEFTREFARRELRTNPRTETRRRQRGGSAHRWGRIEQTQAAASPAGAHP